MASHEAGWDRGPASAISGQSNLRYRSSDNYATLARLYSDERSLQSLVQFLPIRYRFRPT